MNGGFRQSMASLHTWSGLLFGWLLFAMFASGTVAYFQDEITRWMQPEVSGRATTEDAARTGISWLQENAADSSNWFITPPSERAATTQLFWQPLDREKSHSTNAMLDSNGQKVEARETRGGFFLYRFHFDLHYMPVICARYLVGIAAMFMLVAILTGIVTHKKIFADFFLLRFGKGQRSWLDSHNVTAVLALPFHLMITYTGLVTLATLYMPFGIAANYTEPTTFFNQRFPDRAVAEPSGASAPLADVGNMVRSAQLAWNGKDVGLIRVINPGDRNAVVVMTRAPSESVAARGETISFDGPTGRQLSASPPIGPAATTESVMVGLHAGRFADIPLRWLYFLASLFGTAMVGTGTVLWCVKRRQRLPDPSRPHFGFRLVERLNIAVIAGFSAGIAGYFLANRLLPLGMTARAEWEIHCLFIVWGAILVWSVARPARRGWTESLAITALLYALVPLVNTITTARGLPASLLHGDTLFAGFDIAMLVTAGLFGFAAWKSAHHKVAVPSRRKRAAMA